MKKLALKLNCKIKKTDLIFNTPDEARKWQLEQQYKDGKNLFKQNRQDYFNFLMRESDVNMEGATIDKFTVGDQVSNALLTRYERFKESIRTGNGALNLVLCGAYGAGKTFTACCVLNSVMSEGKTVLAKKWASVVHLLWFQSNEKYQRDNFRNLILKVDVLLIDEIGAAETKLTEAQQNELGRLIRSRVNNKKHTILTSNLVGDSFKRSISYYASEGLKEGGVDYLLIPMEQKYNKRQNEIVHVVGN